MRECIQNGFAQSALGGDVVVFIKAYLLEAIGNGVFNCCKIFSREVVKVQMQANGLHIENLFLVKQSRHLHQ